MPATNGLSRLSVAALQLRLVETPLLHSKSPWNFEAETGVTLDSPM